MGRENDLGYPVRCIRNDKWLYIKNYEPGRWPSGNPQTEYTNCDLSPTKELILKAASEKDDNYLNLCFGKRETEELFNIEEDGECINNLAQDGKYGEIKEKLRAKLDEKLEQTGDPRFFGNGDIFESYPTCYTSARLYSWESYIYGTFKRPGPVYTVTKAMVH